LSFGRPKPIWCAIVKTGFDKHGESVTLLSGGLDSTVSLAMALEHQGPALAVFFDYGQRAGGMELKAVEEISGLYGLELMKIELPWFGSVSSSTLIEGNGDPGVFGGSTLEDDSVTGVSSAWVENRNGVFLNIAAAVAAARGSEVIIAGFNREEAVRFPDNRPEYIDAVNASLRLGAGAPVRVVSPTVDMTKRDIVVEGLRLGVPWKSIWSCYLGGELMCGRCESCMRLRRAVSGTPAETEIEFEEE